MLENSSDALAANFPRTTFETVPHVTSTRWSISSMFRTPASAIVTSSSLRMIFDSSGNTGLTASSETIDVSSANQTTSSTKRERTHHVLARTNTTIEDGFYLRADRFGDPWQHRDRRCGAVELSASVIRDDDRGCPGLGGQLRVFHVENALDDQLSRPDAPNPLDIL